MTADRDRANALQAILTAVEGALTGQQPSEAMLTVPVVRLAWDAIFREWDELPDNPLERFPLEDGPTLSRDLFSERPGG